MMKNKVNIVIALAMIAGVLVSCSPLSARAEPEEAAQQPVSDESFSDDIEFPTAGSSTAIQSDLGKDQDNIQQTSDNPSQSDNMLFVQGWLGHVESLPAGAQYDDKLVLYPQAAGEIGISSRDAELAKEIESLRDKEDPGKYAHFWGNLDCQAMDVNGCQLDVTRIRVGASQTEPERIENWQGQLTRGTFNGGASLIFVLTGDFPMQYSIQSVEDDLQAQLEQALSQHAIIEVSGELMTGIPDVNGARITPEKIQVIGYADQSLPVQGEVFEPKQDWKTFVDKSASYQFSYPESGKVSYYQQTQCIVFQTSLGYVAISTTGNRNCLNAQPLSGTKTEKSEDISIDGTIFTAQGYEVIGTSDQLDQHGEYFNVRLPDGTLIEYGSLVRQDATFQDYQMKAYQLIRDVVGSFQITP